MFTVRRPDRRLAGWVEATGTGGWTAFIDGRAVVDPTDDLPWLSGDEQHAVTLLATALDQQPA
ncbi:hypothetical protein OG535_40015 [Kitasatospora sp. NBC_00085]|uniref:hypothetical protein n=1 Tax=unclassified Kitasatospora TaxID=2633591 RepID=UPI00324938B7